jgi:hypothetical protein
MDKVGHMHFPYMQVSVFKNGGTPNHPKLDHFNNTHGFGYPWGSPILGNPHVFNTIGPMGISC